jgi:hypothetical protein
MENDLSVNVRYKEIKVPTLKNVSAKIKVGFQCSLNKNPSLISIR